MHFITVESCIRVGGPIFHNVTVEIWSEGPKLSWQSQCSSTTSSKNVCWLICFVFVSMNIGTRMAESAILTRVGAPLSCWDGILRYMYIQPYWQAFKVVQHYNFNPWISTILTILHWHIIISTIPTLYWWTWLQCWEHCMLLLCMQLALGNESYYKIMSFKKPEILLKICQF